MRQTWGKMRWLGWVVLLVIGCAQAQFRLQAEPPAESWWQKLSVKNWFKGPPNLKPPEHPEELVGPPESDARYSKPVKYPEGTLYKDSLLKKASSKQPGGSVGGLGGPGLGSSSGFGSGGGY